MLGKPTPPWNVGPWYQLPEGKESLDITDFKGKVILSHRLGPESRIAS
jgi:hypothetical protein